MNPNENTNEQEIVADAEQFAGEVEALEQPAVDATTEGSGTQTVAVDPDTASGTDTVETPVTNAAGAPSEPGSDLIDNPTPAETVIPAEAVDAPVLTEDTDTEVVDNAPVEPTVYDGPMGTYRILKPLEVTDEDGTNVGILPVGSIETLPYELGEDMVAKGDAEAYVEPVATEEPAVLGDDTVEAPELKTLGDEEPTEQ